MISRTLAIAGGLAAAISTSQLPEYAQQYRQRLGGAIDELGRVIAEFDADSARHGMSREQGIARLDTSADPFVKDRGARVREDSARLGRLRKQLADFEAAGPFVRMAVLARDFDPGVAARAWDDFEPATPVTTEGAAMAGGGFAAGFVLVRLLAWPWRQRRGLLRAREQSA